MDPLRLGLALAVALLAATQIRRVLRTPHARHPRVPYVPVGVVITMLVVGGLLAAAGVVITAVLWPS